IHVINFLCEDININTLFKRSYSEENYFLNFIDKNKDNLNKEELIDILEIKKKALLSKQYGQGNEITYNILKNIYTLGEYLVNKKNKELLFSELLTVFREDDKEEVNFNESLLLGRDYGSLTNSCMYLMLLLKFVEIESDYEKKIIKLVIENNALLKLGRLFTRLESEEIIKGINSLKEIGVPEFVLLGGLVESINPLIREFNSIDIIKWSDEAINNAFNLFKESNNFISTYILLEKVGAKELDYQSVAKEMLISELQNKLSFKEVWKEVDLLLSGDELSSDFIYSLDRAEPNLCMSRAIGAFCIVSHKPLIFKRYLSLIYSRENVSICRNINNALMRVNEEMGDFNNSFKYYVSLGVDEKLWLQMHLIKLRQGYYDVLTPIIQEKYELIVEVLIENKIYNWDYWLNEIYNVVGDNLLKLSSGIINTGNTEAIKFITDKAKENKKYYKIFTTKTNLEDINVRKGVVEYIISIEHKEKEEFLSNILKSETSKVIKDNINRYLQNEKLRKLGGESGGESGGKEYIVSIVNGDNSVNKGLTKYDFKIAPKVKWENSKEEVEEKILRYILKSYLNNKEVKSNPSIKFIIKALNKEDIEKFSYYILNMWLSTGAEAKERWILSFVGEYGGVEAISLIFNKVRDFADNSRHAMALECLNALALSKKNMAIVYINSIAIKFKYRKIREKANECLDLSAEIRGMSREELEDIIIPNLGFNERGEREFSYGSRSFIVKLNIDNTLQIKDVNGKGYKSLPKGNKSDDEELVKLCDKEFKQLKKDLKSTVAIQAGRLMETLSSKRYWSYETFNNVFIKNPIMTKFALGLIWGVYEEGKLITSFRYMEDGTFTTYDEEDFEL
ncbi:MAG: DUF4132 domain-containing protein, partial [Clostridium sp.]